MKGKKPTPEQVEEAFREYVKLRIHEDELLEHYKAAPFINKYCILRRLREIVTGLIAARNILERAGETDKLNKIIQSS